MQTPRILTLDDETELLPFEELERGPDEPRKIFTLHSDRVRSRTTGKELRVDRLQAPDWVNVVALTDDDHLLCVRQFRFGASRLTLEIPAGTVSPGEEPRAAILRELLEETGHAPASDDDVVALGTVFPNGAFMENHMHSFLVVRAEQTAPLAPDEHEEIEVVKVPLARVDTLVETGVFRGAMEMVALYRYRLWRQRQSGHVG
jgi:ADP-ribose pyrophosphatase